MPISRIPFDLDSYVSRARSGRCFVCAFREGDPDYAHQLVWENDDTIVFLGRHPTVFGRTLVAPKAHVEAVTGDFTEDSYLDQQRVIFWVSEGMRQLLDPERVYLLSLGSQQANAHVHWHVVPLPRGLPLEQQQYHVLMHEHGVLELTPQLAADLSTFALDLGTFLTENLTC